MGVEHYTRVRKLGKGSFGESVNGRAHEESDGGAATAVTAVVSLLVICLRACPSDRPAASTSCSTSAMDDNM